MADLSLQAAASDIFKPDNSLVIGCWWLILLLRLLLNLSFIANWCWFISRLVHPMLWEDTLEHCKLFVVGRCFWYSQILLCEQPPTSQASLLSLAVLVDILLSPRINCRGQICPSLNTIVASILLARNFCQVQAIYLKLSPSSTLGMFIQALINGSLVT